MPRKSQFTEEPIIKALKEVEADRFYAEPTARDFEWYLRTV